MTLSIDDSPEQTRRIMEFEALEAMTPNDPLMGQWKANPEILAYQESLKDSYDILIPYANKIAECFPSDSIQARRDFKKLLTLIKVNAFIHQHQRILVLPKPGITFYLLASPLDFFHAWRISDEAMTETIMSISKRAQRIITTLRKGAKWEIAEIATDSGYSRSRCREILRTLADRGYVNVEQDFIDKRKSIYSLGNNKDRKTVTIHEIAAFLNSLTETDLKTTFEQMYRNTHPNTTPAFDWRIPMCIHSTNSAGGSLNSLSGSYVDSLTGTVLELGSEELLKFFTEDMKNNTSLHPSEEEVEQTKLTGDEKTADSEIATSSQETEENKPKKSPLETIWEALGKGKEQITEEDGKMRLLKAGFRNPEQVWRKLLKDKQLYQPTLNSGYWCIAISLNTPLDAEETRMDSQRMMEAIGAGKEDIQQ